MLQETDRKDKETTDKVTNYNERYLYPTYQIVSLLSNKGYTGRKQKLQKRIQCENNNDGHYIRPSTNDVVGKKGKKDSLFGLENPDPCKLT